MPSLLPLSLPRSQLLHRSYSNKHTYSSGPEGRVPAPKAIRREPSELVGRRMIRCQRGGELGEEISEAETPPVARARMASRHSWL